MSLVFFGTPEAAVVPFEALLAAGFDIPLVVTQPDRRRGRGGAHRAEPGEARRARARPRPWRRPDRAREAIDAIRATGAERGVVVAFGQLLPPALLDAFPKGLVNLHYSLLPRWRGAAPVERAILAGDTETGVCVMDVEETLDTGAVYAREVVPIGADETAGELHARLTQRRRARCSPTTLRDHRHDRARAADGRVHLRRQAHGRGVPPRPRPRRPRSSRASCAAGNPRPGAWLDVDGARLKVWRAHEDDGRFVPDEVQPEGKKAMPYAAWKAGHRGADPFA